MSAREVRELRWICGVPRGGRDEIMKKLVLAEAKPRGVSSGGWSEGRPDFRCEMGGRPVKDTVRARLVRRLAGGGSARAKARAWRVMYRLYHFVP